jgi:hypothetical protein
MKSNLPCKVCNEDGVCYDDQKREEQLKSWLDPYLLLHQLNISGLHGLVFTRKLAVHQYGAEFLRRKNGESVILISEELWQLAQKNPRDLQILQNTLQHELAHVHNNNCLQNMQGGMFYQVSDKSEDFNLFVYRLWDEFYAARLAAISESGELLQAKMTGVLTEARLLAREMTSFEANRYKKREDHQQNLFLTCIYLAGSYSGLEEHREVILRGNLRNSPFVRIIGSLSRVGERLLTEYPFQHYKELTPLAETYLGFKTEMDRRYRPLWRRIFSPLKTGKLILKQ